MTSWLHEDSFTRFAQELVTALGIESALGNLVDPARSPDGAWHLDSLQLLELVVAIEELAGGPRAGVDLPRLVSVEDAYRYYCALRSGWGEAE